HDALAQLQAGREHVAVDEAVGAVAAQRLALVDHAAITTEARECPERRVARRGHVAQRRVPAQRDVEAARDFGRDVTARRQCVRSSSASMRRTRARTRRRSAAPPAHVAGPAASVYKPNPTDRDGREVAMQSVAVQHPHLLIWREPPAWPFVWRGLLPLAALALTASFAAGPVARTWIEGAVQREAREQIVFASGSAAIDARSGALLDRLAREARSCPGTLRIEGHTDPVGRSAFNRRLSQARAAAVREALIARGVPAGRLRARGFAARRPIADNATESGRARN